MRCLNLPVRIDLILFGLAQDARERLTGFSLPAFFGNEKILCLSLSCLVPVIK